MPRRLLRAWLLGALAWAAGPACRGRPASPPYAVGEAPSAEILRRAAQPAIAALIVPQARLREAGHASASLMLAAQAEPSRLAASVVAAGNELVSVAVTEHGYGLRWLADDHAYYEGPAAACVVEATLGVPLLPSDLVRLLLGGAPTLPGARVVAQEWRGERVRPGAADRHPGREVLRLAGDGAEQELAFEWLSGRWVLAGATVWSVDGARRKLRFSVVHERLRSVDGAVLPGRTRIRRPGPDNEVVLDYGLQRPDPPELRGETGGTDDPWDDGGWEDADPAAEAADAVAPAPNEAGASGDSSPVERGAPSENLPAVFRIEAAGLPARGDLCAKR